MTHLVCECDAAAKVTIALGAEKPALCWGCLATTRHPGEVWVPIRTPRVRLLDLVTGLVNVDRHRRQVLAGIVETEPLDVASMLEQEAAHLESMAKEYPQHVELARASSEEAALLREMAVIAREAAG